MADISAALVKELRGKTGAGIMDCKEALKNSDGDMEKAVEFLRKKGLATAAKRAGRETSEGFIASYIHTGGKLGVMVEVNCETDFVAKSDDFQAFARNIAMHVAATNPVAVTSDDVPAEIVEKEMEIYRGQARELGKPEQMVDKIAQGKLQKFYKENCLMDQAYVKDPTITVTDVLNELIAKIGESISIRRFVRYQIGE